MRVPRSTSGSFGAALFVANVMDSFVPPMLRCFFWLLRYPRIYGADIARALGVRISDGSSPRTRGKSLLSPHLSVSCRFIPVYTGQIAEAVRTGNSPPIHPRVYGADTKLPKKISEIAEHPLPPQNPMIESVCIIFLKCIFADNTFWLFSMFFCKKRDAGGTSFSVCFLVMTFFFVCAQSVSKRLHMTVRFYTFPAVEDSYI